MDKAEALQQVVDAQSTMAVKREAFTDGTAERDLAVVAARYVGASVIDIADTLGLSRQQVHKIIAAHTAGPMLSDFA